MPPFKDPGFKNLSAPLWFSKAGSDDLLPSYRPNEKHAALLRDAFRGTLSDLDIVKSIEFLNENHDIINSNIYGGIENIGIVLIIQVHDRLEYLKLLVESLSTVKGIERALLVFSHDYYSEGINYLIQSIRFCQVCFNE